MKYDFSLLNKLFFEKKYSKIISFIENNSEDKSSQVLNLLAVSRMLNDKNKDSFLLAIADFKKAYLKEKTSKVALESLNNFLTATVDFYDYIDAKKESLSFQVFFEDAIFLFKEAENYFGYNSDLVSGVIKIYKRLNDIEKVLFYFDKLNNNNDLDITKTCSWLLYNHYIKNWSQKDFYNNSQLLQNKIKNYSEKKLEKINKNYNLKKKIAFLSSDILRRHSITYFLKTVLSNYDKDKFEIYLFLNHSQVFDDDTTQDFKKLVSKYFHIDYLNDIEAINLIRNENIDIMFDLMGLTSSHRTSLFKNRLAPVQITWLGYCNTTGLNEMDYLIADPKLIYPEEEKYYAEKIIYMPNIWSCHSGFSFKPKTYDPPCLKNNFITFGSFNNFAKINKDVVYTWSKVLQNIKGSKLILKSSVRVRTSELKKMFQDFGVLNSVVFLENEASFERHLNLYNEIDIALDTFPYNGVTTSFEALWMGVPVITMSGYNFNSRCGESIIKNTKIDYLIASNKSEYVQKAIYLANNIKELLKIRKKLFNTVLSTPLFDTKSFAKEFEDILLKILKK